MSCKECGLAAVSPDKSQPSERVFLGTPHIAPGASGTWLYLCKDAELCSYHRRKAEGHFDREPEYYRKNRGPNEWTQYGR